MGPCTQCQADNEVTDPTQAITTTPRATLHPQSIIHQ